MEGRANYQFGILPPNLMNYMVLDSQPERRSEANLVYTITGDVFAGTPIQFRIRKKAKEFAETGKVFAVIYKDEKKQKCLYFGKLFIKERDYPLRHTQPVFYLSRCVGKNFSKKHFKKVSEFILSHYERISQLKYGDSFEVKL